MNHSATLIAVSLATPFLRAQDADLAKKLSNPVADLISLPSGTGGEFGPTAVVLKQDGPWTAPHLNCKW